MRILFLNPVGELGGAERALLTAIVGIRGTCPTATVKLIAGADGPLLAEARRHGAEAEVVEMPAGMRSLGDSASGGKNRKSTLGMLGGLLRSVPGGVNYLRRLRKHASDFHPSIVHTNGIKCHILSRIVVPRGIPVIWWAQDFFSPRPLAQRLLRMATGRCRLVLAISQAVADDVAAALPGVPVSVLYHAVDTTRFRPGPGNGPELDRLAGLPVAAVDTIRVGLVATYARWKGQLTLLDAAAQLQASPPCSALRWYIVGGPIYFTAAQFSERELKEETARRRLDGRVGFVPFVDDPASIYRSLDIVVHASTQPEPFGLVIAEAMATGRAVVVSAAGGAAELFTEGVDALGIEPGNAEQLAGAVKRLADDADLRQRLGESARKTALTRFDASQYGRRLCRIYESVLHDSSSAGV